VSGRRWLAVAACFVAAAAAVVAAAGRGESRGSTVSRGAGGWLAARRYLEARGARVTLITEPLGSWVHGEAARSGQGGEESMARSGQGGGEPMVRRGQASDEPIPGGHLADGPGRGAGGHVMGGPGRGAGVLVLVFPWTGLPTGDLDEAIDTHLGRGGDLVLAYSGEESGAERLVGLWQWRPAGKVPLAPWRWRAFMRREWLLRPVPGTAPRAAVRVWAPRVLPEVGSGTRVLFTSPRGLPAVAVFRQHGGRVVMLPADALANSRLGDAGNVDLLETLLANLGPRWAFDEYHHGLVTADAGGAGLGRTADLLLAHLVLLYLLAVLALARRQGPPWHEAPVAAGSAASFLRGLGALHHRLGHHHEAALLLLRRARELDRTLVLPSELDARAAAAGPEELVDIARQVARRRAGRATTAASGDPR
jgi:hypothetical protein